MPVIMGCCLGCGFSAYYNGPCRYRSYAKEWTMHCCDHVDLNFADAKKIALFGAAGRLKG